MAKNECAWRNQKEHSKRILPLIHKHKEIIVFDTETTGLGKTAKIIQFSAVHYRIKAGYELEEIKSMDVYLNPEEPLSEKIVEITGITDSMLKNAPTEAEIGLSIFDFLQTCKLWAAYNGAFDLRMLDQMSNRIQVLYEPAQCLDVLEMARDFVSKSEAGSHKLSDVLETLFPEKSFQFHSALEDVKATATIMSKFLVQYRKAFQSPPELKRQVYMEWASAYINPHQPSQQRIKLKLNEGDYGDIYWDAVRNQWGCKSTKSAKSLFQEVDLANLESQLLNRYGWRYDVREIADLAKAMMAAARKKKGA